MRGKAHTGSILIAHWVFHGRRHRRVCHLSIAQVEAHRAHTQRKILGRRRGVGVNAQGDYEITVLADECCIVAVLVSCVRCQLDTGGCINPVSTFRTAEESRSGRVPCGCRRQERQRRIRIGQPEQLSFSFAEDELQYGIPDTR
ncbi:hypothetical protein D3C85_964910 [compost metagenome]